MLFLAVLPVTHVSRKSSRQSPSTVCNDPRLTILYCAVPALAIFVSGIYGRVLADCASEHGIQLALHTSGSYGIKPIELRATSYWSDCRLHLDQLSAKRSYACAWMIVLRQRTNMAHFTSQTISFHCSEYRVGTGVEIELKWPRAKWA